MDNNLGKFIKERLQERGMSQRKLSLLSGISNTTISRIINGATEYPDVDTLKKIAPYLLTTLDELMQKAGYYNSVYKDKLNKENDDNTEEYLPVYEFASAGEPILVEDNIIDYISVPKSIVRGGHHVAVRIKGNSMSPKIEDGDIVIIKIQPIVDEGRIGVVFIEGEGVTVKRVYVKDDYYHLLSDNPAYPPQYHHKQKVRIIGLAKRAIKELY